VKVAVGTQFQQVRQRIDTFPKGLVKVYQFRFLFNGYRDVTSTPDRSWQLSGHFYFAVTWTFQRGRTTYR